MSTAKRYTIVECHNDDEVWFKMKEVTHGDYVLYSDYKELEQELTKLKESQTQLCNRVDKAEAENREMREALILIKHKLKTDPAITDTIWIDDNPKCLETAVDRINDLLRIDE